MEQFKPSDAARLDTCRRVINPFKQFVCIPIPEAIARYRGLSPGAKIVYGRLQRYAGQKGVAFPHVDALAEEVGLGERQTRSYLRELTEERFIQSRREFAKGNVYEFLDHPAFDGELGAKRGPEEPVANRQDAAGQQNGPANRQDAAAANRQDAAAVEPPVSLLPEKGQKKRVSNSSPTPSLESLPEPEKTNSPEWPYIPEDELNLEDPIEVFLANAARRINRRCKLPNLRAKAQGQMVSRLQELDASDATSLRRAWIVYLNADSEWLRTAKWTLHAFLNHPTEEFWLKDVPGTELCAPALGSLGGAVAPEERGAPSPTPPPMSAAPAASQGLRLPQEIEAWNVLVPSAPMIATWIPSLDPQKALEECRRYPQFETGWQAILATCERIFRARGQVDASWLTPRWLLRKDAKSGLWNWYRVLVGEMAGLTRPSVPGALASTEEIRPTEGDGSEEE